MKRKQKGFSLIELLIVVSVILIIAAIAIPNLMASRAKSVETAAVGSLKAMTTALAGYQTKWHTFPPDLKSVGGNCATTAPTPASACEIADAVATGMNSGTYGDYTWTYLQGTGGGGFTLNADPAPTANKRVTLHLYVDEGVAVHRNDTAPASASDPTI